jgi:hypothetical protein
MTAVLARPIVQFGAKDPRHGGATRADGPTVANPRNRDEAVPDCPAATPLQSIEVALHGAIHLVSRLNAQWHDQGHHPVSVAGSHGIRPSGTMPRDVLAFGTSGALNLNRIMRLSAQTDGISTLGGGTRLTHGA